MGNGFVLRRTGACVLALLLGLPGISFGDQAPAGTVVEAGQWDALEAALKTHGWRVERDSEGALLLFPPLSEPGPETTDPLPAETGERIDAADLDALQAAAAERGWGHRRETDGSLVLLPPGFSAEAGNGTPCQIGMVRVSGAEGIPLPVDTEDKAYRLAEFWLREGDVDSVLIGRIRQINRLVLVSLVENEEPFFLHTQLVIRADDGCLMAIPR